MAKIAIIRTGGQQFLVRENEEIYVQRIPNAEKETVELETLGIIDDSDNSISFGEALPKSAVKAEVISHLKGDKVRVAKFKAKVRYRRVTGFRHSLTKLRITKI